jgi:hypothetical protein
LVFPEVARKSSPSEGEFEPSGYAYLIEPGKVGKGFKKVTDGGAKRASGRQARAIGMRWDREHWWCDGF